MEFVSGLNLDINSAHVILGIAQTKGYLIDGNYINKCVNFRFNAKDRVFEFYVLNLNNSINLEMDKFIECYTEFLKK